MLVKDAMLRERIDRIPGRQTDRKSLLGELNWIFTSITDTIAWNVLPRDLFQRLFRQDLLLASLFRNFMLAERIMKSAGAAPQSWPRLPPLHQHQLWEAWDVAAEAALLQLPAVMADESRFIPSAFFAEQLTAFELWLSHTAAPARAPPQQLPIVLQVLLSQVHRLRALRLLGRYLDQGPACVELALSVGIFPYVLKLLQTTLPTLRPHLVFIWCKILATDEGCHQARCLHRCRCPTCASRPAGTRGAARGRPHDGDLLAAFLCISPSFISNIFRCSPSTTLLGQRSAALAERAPAPWRKAGCGGGWHDSGGRAARPAPAAWR